MLWRRHHTATSLSLPEAATQPPLVQPHPLPMIHRQMPQPQPNQKRFGGYRFQVTVIYVPMLPPMETGDNFETAPGRCGCGRCERCGAPETTWVALGYRAPLGPWVLRATGIRFKKNALIKSIATITRFHHHAIRILASGGKQHGSGCLAWRSQCLVRLRHHHQIPIVNHYRLWCQCW